VLNLGCLFVLLKMFKNNFNTAHLSVTTSLSRGPLLKLHLLLNMSVLLYTPYTRSLIEGVLQFEIWRELNIGVMEPIFE